MVQMVVDVAGVERTALRLGARCSGSMFICQAAVSPCAASASTLSTACCRRVIQIDHAPIMLGAHVGSVLVSDTAHAGPCRVELRRVAVPLSSPRGSDPGDARRAGRGCVRQQSPRSSKDSAARPYPHTLKAPATALKLSADEAAALATVARWPPRRAERAAPPEPRGRPGLPRPLTRILGREGDVAEVRRLLDRSPLGGNGIAHLDPASGALATVDGGAVVAAVGPTGQP